MRFCEGSRAGPANVDSWVKLKQSHGLNASYIGIIVLFNLVCLTLTSGRYVVSVIVAAMDSILISIALSFDSKLIGFTGKQCYDNIK